MCQDRCEGWWGRDTLGVYSACGMTILHSERLILRRWTLDDFEDFAAMSADPEVMRFITPDGQPLSRFAAWQALCAIIGHWELRGFGLFAALESATERFVGRVGPWHPEEWPDLEIGWTIRKEFWGKGYATEAANRCIDYAFMELNREHLVSLILPENLRSIRVAERLGERLEGTTRIPHLPGRELLQYGMSREEWKQRSALRGSVSEGEA
jgi:RimJ/RimL family protein N-acetyltransferase